MKDGYTGSSEIGTSHEEHGAAKNGMNMDKRGTGWIPMSRRLGRAAEGQSSRVFASSWRHQSGSRV